MAEENRNKPSKFVKDISGLRFGRLVAIRFNDVISTGARWLCKCDCGREVITTTNNLKNGSTKSCGCLRKENSAARFTTHGKRRSQEWNIWICAKNRCFNPRCAHYSEYGGRGITMCPEWAGSFEAFFRDMGPRPEGTSLDRINNDLGYHPDNCRWASIFVQNNNQRRSIRLTHNGVTLSLKEWAARLGISEHTMRNRYQKGLPLFIPLQKACRK